MMWIEVMLILMFFALFVISIELSEIVTELKKLNKAMERKEGKEE